MWVFAFDDAGYIVSNLIIYPTDYQSYFQK